MPRLDLGFSASIAFVLLLALAAAAFSVYSYRFTTPVVSRRRRVVLIFLRTSALILTGLLLFEPLLRLTFFSRHEPLVAVLIDDSRSMRLVDRAGDRASLLRTTLRSSAFKDLEQHGELRWFTFGTSLHQVHLSTNDSLSLEQDGTDISGAIQALVREQARTPIAAAIILTDGSYNVGPNPLHVANEPGVPLYVVGIGDSSEQKDLLVTRVIANELVYSGEKAPVDITIKSSGFGGEKVEVTLLENGRELDRTSLTLEGGTREYPVRLSYVPEGEGQKKFSVKVSQLPGEITTANNARTFHARVLRSKLRVIVLAGSPGPDVAIVRQALAETKNFAVRSFTVRPPAGFYEGTLSDAVLDSADCLFLVGFPDASTPPGVISRIANAITRTNKPLFFIDGATLDYRLLNGLAPLLPFTVEQTSAGEQAVYAAPAPRERSNPLLALGPEHDAAAWDRLPPIQKSATVFKAKVDAAVLAFSRVQNVTLPEPLILARSLNRAKVLAVTGHAIWRWRLMAQDDAATRDLFPSFIFESVKWLTTPEENQPVKVSAVPDYVPLGQPVQFSGQVYDASLHPVDNSTIRITARQEGKVFESVMRPIGDGRYEGSLEGMPAGDYTFVAVAEADGRTLGESRGRFTVGGLDVEFQDTRMDASLLQQLARQSGGIFVLPSRVDTLVAALTSSPSFKTITTERRNDIELWHWQYLLALIVILFAVEWFLRKRSGML